MTNENYVQMFRQQRDCLNKSVRYSIYKNINNCSEVDKMINVYIADKLYTQSEKLHTAEQCAVL